MCRKKCNIVYNSVFILLARHESQCHLNQGTKCFSMLPGEDERVGRLPNALVVKEKQRLAMLVVSKAQRQILELFKESFVSSHFMGFQNRL